MPQTMIGELLLRRGTTREALAQAWEQKVLFGDRLGTNLLAEQLIDEKTLALALGEQYGVHAAYKEVLRLDPRALHLVKRNIVERHSVIPHHVDGDSLYLLMEDPNNLLAIDEVQATTRLSVVPVVVCEARMWQLLGEIYGISRSLRPIALDGDPFLEAERLRKRRQESVAAGEFGPELTDEHEFQALYGQRREEPGAHTEAPQAAVHEGPTLSVVPLPGVEVSPTDEPLVLTEEEELQRITFEEAHALLIGVTDRDEIARVVLRYAIGRFARACLLTVHPTGFAGWEGAGPDCSTSVVRRFQLRASEESVFSLVVGSRAHYIGPLQRHKAHGPWVKLLGRQLPLSVAVFPVLVRGRVVNLLYGDNGHNEHVNQDVGELLILVQHIARSYETLIASAPGAAATHPGER